MTPNLATWQIERMTPARRPLLTFGLIATFALAANFARVAAQEPPIEVMHVDFPSLDGKTRLIAHLFRPEGDEPRPAVVMLHGCSGLLGKNGRLLSIYGAWASEFLKAGYVVLVVDSARSRGFGETCSANAATDTRWK